MTRHCKKNTLSTHTIDLPQKLRREVGIFLALPLKDIFNICLSQEIFPDLLKEEYVTPIPKVPEVLELMQSRKIACTSDFSKLLEGLL